MTEWVMIIWMWTSAGMSDPIEVGTYQSYESCMAAAEEALEKRVGGKSGTGATAVCVERDK